MKKNLEILDNRHKQLKMNLEVINRAFPSTKGLRLAQIKITELGLRDYLDFTTEGNEKCFGGYFDDSEVERYSVEVVHNDDPSIEYRVTQYKLPNYSEEIETRTVPFPMNSPETNTNSGDS